MKLQCSKCQYVKTYFENEVMRDEECGLCGSKMVLPKKEIEYVVEHDSILLMEKQIKELGHSKVWRMVERFPQVKTRLAFRRLFFKAGGIIPKLTIVK